MFSSIRLTECLCAVAFSVLFDTAAFDTLVFGQILLNPPSEANAPGSYFPGITIGGDNPSRSPYADPVRSSSNSPLYNENKADGLPPLLSGSTSGSILFGNDRPYVPLTVPKTPSYTPSEKNFRITPGMTREEIVRLKAEEKRINDLEQSEAHEKIWSKLRIEQNIKEHINALLEEEFSYRPMKLLKNQTEDKTEPSLTVVRPENEWTKPETLAKELTEAERYAREIEEQRKRLSMMVDPVQKERAAELIKRREEARKQWLLDRAEKERGADIFELPVAYQIRRQLLQEGWCLLFDGKTSFGWRTQKEGYYGGGKFTFSDGMIQSDPAHPGLLYSTCQLGDSTISLEFQAENDSEAFLLLRSSPSPADIHTSCYAIVLQSPDPSRPRGTILGRSHLTQDELNADQKRRENEKKRYGSSPPWHRLVAQFGTTRLQLTFDKEQPISMFDNKPLGYGYVGLLVTKGKVRFRTVMWNPGMAVQLLNDGSYDRHFRKLDDNIVPSATRKILQFNGGPGALETKANYDNFALQCQYSISYTSGKAAVRVRAADAKASGIMVSLQNFPTRKDRDEGKGVDAGSFIGMKNGRYVRAQDQSWNFLTIVASGNHYQTWVNGIPVCEFNPSAAGADVGLNDSGKIQLVLPAKDGNVQFSSVSVSPFPPRKQGEKTMKDWEKDTYKSQLEAGRKHERD